jgi:hypothetical protein
MTSLRLFVYVNTLLNLTKVQSKIDSFHITEADIQRDFIEVWMNIEESIWMHERNHRKHVKKKKSDKNKTTINLNFKL